MNNHSEISTDLRIVINLFLFFGILGTILFLFGNVNSIIFLINFFIYYYLRRWNETWREITVCVLVVSIISGIAITIIMFSKNTSPIIISSAFSAGFNHFLFHLYIITMTVVSIWGVIVLSRRSTIELFELKAKLHKVQSAPVGWSSNDIY
jgi:hypothetical protein